MVGKPCTIMATLEDIEVYESLNFASVVSYDLDALETVNKMERIIGKYTLNVTSEEINKDNFFKHSVSVLKPEFIYIDKSELSLWLAQTFRYSNDEKALEQ